MRILTTILQAIAPFTFLIGAGIVVIYSLISINTHTLEWLMLLVGLGLIGLTILIVRFVQKREHLDWIDALFGLWFWT